MRKFLKSSKRVAHYVYEAVSMSCTISAAGAAMVKLQGASDSATVETFIGLFLLGAIGGPILHLLVWSSSMHTSMYASRRMNGQ